MGDNFRRASFVIVIGEGDGRWSFPDPGHPLVSEAQRHVRYGKPLADVDSNALTLAEVASALHYLIHVCPTTELAVEKLRTMRRAVRALPTKDPDHA